MHRLVPKGGPTASFGGAPFLGVELWSHYFLRESLTLFNLSSRHGLMLILKSSKTHDAIWF
jgi:hypothetical protein